MPAHYTLQCSESVAGMPVHAASTQATELHTLAKQMTLHQAGDDWFASSEAGPVQLVAATQAPEPYESRIYVGVRDKRNKRLKLMPAAAFQITRLQPRLHNIDYDAGPLKDTNLNDAARRRIANTDLVGAFGSTRRVRQLGQKAEGRLENISALAPEAMTKAVEAMGKQAQQEGYTSAQVLQKVTEDLALPAHDPQATTAEAAYMLSSILNRNQMKHLESSFLLKSMCDRTGVLRHGKRCDGFVEAVLEAKHAWALANEGNKAVREACQWLALYNNCRKLLRLRSGTEIANDEAPEDDKDEDSKPDRSTTTMEQLVRQYGFFSAEAMRCFMLRFGSLVASPTGETFRTTTKQQRQLKLLLVICAVRCNGCVLDAKLGGALLDSLAAIKIEPQEAKNLLRESGCTVSSGPSKAGQRAVKVSLLSGGNAGLTLADCLPAIKKPNAKSKRR